jgi:alkaline phosphatase
MESSLKALITVLFAAQLSGAPHARNVILFIGDGAGISSLNAASIYGYGEPQALYLESMPYVALSDTSTASGWVTDGSASLSAVATGVKTQIGIVSESANAVRGKKDGTLLKTVLEYAEEHGLATGVISNEDKAGISDGVVSAFYAHSNDRMQLGANFLQILAPRFGDGLDVAIGSGRKRILEDVSKLGRDLPTELRAHGYGYFESLDALAGAGTRPRRAVVLMDDYDFYFARAVDQAIAILESNPKGFFLVAHSDCHWGDSRRILGRILALDRVVRKVAERHRSDTLVLFTADHSYDLHIRGEDPKQTGKGIDILPAIKMEDYHTAEEVPLLATGPGSEQVHGFISNTQVFHIILNAFGWGKEGSH